MNDTVGIVIVSHSKDIAKGTADMVAGPCKTIAGRAPAQWKEAWDKVSKRLFLDNIGGRLLRLLLRALVGERDVGAALCERAGDRRSNPFAAGDQRRSHWVLHALHATSKLG